MKDKEGMLKKLTAGLAAFVLTLLPLAGTVSAATLPGGNPIANYSVEDGAPSNWTPSSWGSAVAIFTHENEGHEGSKSVKVTNTDATPTDMTDGDAKWYFNPISTSVITPGQYRFSNWYKTNVQPQAVVMYLDAAGNESFFGMPTPTPQVGQDATTTWQPYSATFSVPAGATAVSVFMYINQSGWLQTDDYSIEDYAPVGFNEAMLSLTFDDGHEDNKTTALPLLNELGFKTTQCYATTFIEDVTPAELKQEVVAGVMQFANSGHEICSHTVTHPDMTTINDTQLAYELQHSKEYLEQLLAENGASQTVVSNFASPFGAYNAHVNDMLKAAGYQAHRTVNEGYNTKDNFDQYQLRVQNILSTTTPEQVAEWVAQAQADKTWLILVYHRVANDPGPYDASIENFTGQMQKIKESGIAVKTYQDALASAKAQLSGDTTSPVISDVNAIEGGVEVGGGFQVNWKTNELSVCTIEYGTTTAYGQTATVPAAPFTPNNFVYNMYGLSADTTYFFRITATDAAGNPSGVYTGDFKTSANHLPGRPGDINHDGLVNLNDLSILSNNWNSTTATAAQGDLNGDGKVTLNDLSILSSNWSTK